MLKYIYIYVYSVHINYILIDGKRRCEDNIKIDRREVEWGDMDWINVAQDTDQWRALLSMVMDLRIQ
jgi:hypothetical protein